MSTLVLIALALRGLGDAQTQDGGGEPPQAARRVIDGRMTDAHGRPVHEGKVLFAHQNPPLAFQELWAATIDSQGYYHVELATYPVGATTIPPTGRLRYLALVPGFRGETGRVDTESGPAKVDIRLVPEEWRSTEIVLQNTAVDPVAGARVSLMLGGRTTWSRQITDPQGRCVVKSAPGITWICRVEHPDYMTTEFGSRGATEDPPMLRVPLFASIEGRVVDPSGNPWAGIQIGRLLSDRVIVTKTSEPLMVLPFRGAKDFQVTDSQGRFKLSPLTPLNSRDLGGNSRDIKTQPLTVCFADPTMHHVFFTRLDVQGARHAHEIVLHQHVPCAFRSSTLPPSPTGSF